MNKKISTFAITFSIVAISLSSILFPLTTYADFLDPNDSAITQPTSQATGPGTSRLITIINRLTNWLLGLLITISSIFIIYAAYLYLTAGANPDNAKKAGSIILYAAIAIAIGLLSKVFVFVVRELVK